MHGSPNKNQGVKLFMPLSFVDLKQGTTVQPCSALITLISTGRLNTKALRWKASVV